MSTFDKREDDFEKKFAHDEELRFKAQARRDKLLGLWAADKLGKSGQEAEAYASEPDRRRSHRARRRRGFPQDSQRFRRRRSGAIGPPNPPHDGRIARQGDRRRQGRPLIGGRNGIMDQVSAAVRSRMMRAIRSKNTKPELQVRRTLHIAGYRSRLHRKDLPGTPDLVLPRYRMAVQINGCFWHRHDCPRGRRRPSSNVDYWDQKLERNWRRQAAAAQALSEAGWSVVTIWECELKAGIDALLRESREPASIGYKWIRLDTRLQICSNARR